MKAKDKSKELTPEAQAQVFAQLLGHLGTMPVSLARQILKVKFAEADQTRISELLTKNSEDAISAVELDELDGLVRAGEWLAILHSKARIALKATTRKATARA